MEEMGSQAMPVKLTVALFWNGRATRVLFGGHVAFTDKTQAHLETQQAWPSDFQNCSYVTGTFAFSIPAS